MKLIWDDNSLSLTWNCISMAKGKFENISKFSSLS